MKEAEKHAKQKQDKLQRIKQVRSQIAGLQSEIGKAREVREECSRYKGFLDKLTPPEWKEQQIEIKKNRKAKRREQYIAARMVTVNSKFAEDEDKIASEAAAGETVRRPGKKGRGQEEEAASKERERQARRKKLHRRKEDEEKRIATEYEDQEVSSEEELELFFKEPKQLMDTFTELEEKNLFLIQSTQETEQHLDELKSNFENNAKEMGSKVQHLNENVRNLQVSISQEKKQCDQLQQSLQEKGGTEAQDKKLADLYKEVHEVHEKCGLNDDHNPDILQMLGAIESKLEELIHDLDEAFHQDSDLVMRLEKQKEKERRERVRAEKVQEQNDKQEDRLKNSLLRSQAPVFKKAGKQVMYRSPPLRQERKVVKDSSDDEKNVHDHKVFGMYIDRKTQLPQTEPPVVEDARHARADARAAAQAAALTTGDGDTTLDPAATAAADGDGDTTLDPAAIAAEA